MSAVVDNHGHGHDDHGHHAPGLAQAPDAIAGLYRGENLGKRLIRVDHGA